METFPLIAPGVRRLTVNLDSDDVTLFEDRWPVPEGVALHCYLIQAGDVVLIDPWSDGGYGYDEVAEDLEALGLSWSQVKAVAVTKESARPPLPASVEWWGAPAPGARHDLGGLVLEENGGFWTASGVVFSGDTFAGLGWVEDELWTEDLGEYEARYFEDEALRWFATRPLVPAGVPPGFAVAPAHGCLWKRSEAALARAERFAAWAEDGADEVTVVWPAHAQESADALVGGVLDIGAGLNLLRVPGDDATALAAAARRASLVVVEQSLDASFLKGLTKDVWRPAASTPAAELRAGIIAKWEG